MNKALRSCDPKPCKTTRKKWWVIAIGNSLLWGTKAPICWPDLSLRGLLPAGGLIQDAVEGLSKLVRPSDCYSLLSFYVAISDTATGYLETIRSVYRALWAVVKGRWCPQSCWWGQRVWGGDHWWYRSISGCRVVLGDRVLGSTSMGPCLLISVCSWDGIHLSGTKLCLENRMADVLRR